MKDYSKSILKGIYISSVLMFLILAMVKEDTDIIEFGRTLSFAAIYCVVTGIGYFIIRRYFSKGDKYLFILACFLVQFGLPMIYRINQTKAYKQLLWFAISVLAFLIFNTLLPALRRLEKGKAFYAAAGIILILSTMIIGSEIKGSIN
jgi:drug/metabolite transporter superfamily protein YnfA